VGDDGFTAEGSEVGVLKALEIQQSAKKWTTFWKECSKPLFRVLLGIIVLLACVLIQADGRTKFRFLAGSLGVGSLVSGATRLVERKKSKDSIIGH
jgi:hypothetical protein